MENHIKIFSICIPVNGHNRSIIYDLQRNKYSFIPNDLYLLIKNHDGELLTNIKASYKNKFDDIIDEYFDFLVKNEYGFFTNSPQMFPDLDLVWKSSSHITNAIIAQQNSGENYKVIFEKLDCLNCKAIQLRLLNLDNWELLNKILKLTDNSRIKHIDLFLPYMNERFLDDYKKLVFNFNRIWNIYIHNAPSNKIEFIDEQKAHPIIFTTQKITDNNFCGTIHPNKFVQNIPFFTESQQFNTCLNRKISFDEDGFIKNCLSMKKHYGNINEVDLKMVVKTEEFQKLWYIKKDDIKVCKDCEFRHMCMDCRAIIKDPDNIYSQPAKCLYNPYIAKWDGQPGYITVEEWQYNQQNVKSN